MDETQDRLLKTTKRYYDDFNRLIKIKDAEQKETEYAYDDLGRRTTVKLHGQTALATTIYDPAGRTKEIVKEKKLEVASKKNETEQSAPAGKISSSHLKYEFQEKGIHIGKVLCQV